MKWIRGPNPEGFQFLEAHSSNSKIIAWAQCERLRSDRRHGLFRFRQMSIQQKARGVVELPLHIRWSGPPKTYDLSNKRDRALVYEQVLAEGTDEDIRYFIEIPELIDLWEELFLPAHVRLRWAAWLKKNQNIDLA